MNKESLNLWDRIFNRYKKVIISRGKQEWTHRYSSNGYNYHAGERVPNSEYYREYVEYKIIDRVTGSETIKLEYLN